MGLKLYAGTVELGTLTTDDIDWPRTYYHFAPAGGFETVRGFFERHVRVEQGTVEDLEEFEEQCRALDLRVIDEESQTTMFMDMVLIVGGSEAVIRHGFLRRIDEKGVVKWVRHDDSVLRPIEDD